MKQAHNIHYRLYFQQSQRNRIKNLCKIILNFLTNLVIGHNLVNFLVRIWLTFFGNQYRITHLYPIISSSLFVITWIIQPILILSSLYIYLIFSQLFYFLHSDSIALLRRLGLRFFAKYSNFAPAEHINILSYF